ncbi:uncharacterized protein DUF2779 [Acidovorax sp. 99]|uniref:DUF2779 domain-containing protein n=1 Tax=Acidovorax sp. 99 TaxID=2135634 RepID=UPI000D5DB2D0|nr:DUF2779 domain-containing protein [Acidovorax sp. 99]PVY91171.1 uncharacterized protein DUF2779 [Acidovorax sp. 99]
MRALSKSKLIAFRQCSKRLWLEVHQPEARQDSAATQAVFQTGHAVGALAQQIYDPAGDGATINLQAAGVAAAVEQTRELLLMRKPLFEAGMSAAGGLAFADVMLPVMDGATPAWKMVEVKSSTAVKTYQEDDAAIQSYIARAAGVEVRSVCIAHIDAAWIYPGGGDYRGLLIEKDVTEGAYARSMEVAEWIGRAQRVAAQAVPPDVQMGAQCETPFPCGFQKHCQKNQHPAEFPVAWLPRTSSKALKDFLGQTGAQDMREIPEALLTPVQRRVRDATVSGRAYFDAEGARQDLLPYPLPAYFLDFETIQFGVPRWAGTRPFQMLPFQFSLHQMDAQGQLSHEAFVDISGDEPSEAFAAQLVRACALPLPVFVYHAGFEGNRLKELAQCFPALAPELEAIRGRLVDLLPIARARYYDPRQHGSWSIKKVLPAIAPHLGYDALTGVQDGGMAMAAYLEAIAPATSPQRKALIRDELLAYCALDTLAMVEIWKKFSQSYSIPQPTGSTQGEKAMLTQSPAHFESSSEVPFFAALMQHLMQGTMIPKVQVERSIGPIIGFFLEKALKARLGADLVMLSPEFPIRKSRLAEQGNNQSTNIDWLMLNLDAPELLMVELKTTDTTFSEDQAQIYQELQAAIESTGSAAFLLDELLAIKDASQEPGKYGFVLELLKTACQVRSETELREHLDSCKRARVIYLAPKLSKPKNWRSADQGWEWISFENLPVVLDEHEFADQWPTLREHLVSLDEATRSKRNRNEELVVGGKNYRELIKFSPLLKRARSEGAAMVVSLQNWRTVLPTMTLQQLEAKTFKYDLADGGKGKKDPKNWITGDQFLAQIAKLQPC